ncbi:MAG TPA: hypothetical protein VF221_19150, partial [Chloroflexota bacterium]
DREAMTSGVAPSVSSLLEEIADIARELNRHGIVETVSDALEHRRASKLRLLVVGSVGSGRATLANVLLGRPDLIPESPIPKPPVGIDIQHGERISAVRIGPDDSRAAIPTARLRAVVTEPDGGRGERVAIQAPSELLELCDLRIESIDATLSPAGWRAALGRTDYVIFLLNGAALLSDAERRFVRDHLAPELGLERVAIVVTHMDLVPEEERDSILDLLRTFLGPYESQPAILGVSLREGSDAGGSDGLSILMSDLLERRAPVRDAAIRRMLETVLDELDAAAAETEALYAMEETDVRRVQGEIAAQRTWLEGRIERMHGRVETFVETLLKEQLLRRIEAFGETVRARLPQEIDSVDDVALVRRYLPGYLETVWTEYLRGRTIAVRGELAEEEERMNAMIEADVSELLGGAGQAGLGRDFAADAPGLHVFVIPRRGKHRATNVARGLSLNGFFMLFLAPQLGIISLAASQVIQRIYKDDIDKADRQAMTVSAIMATRELEREVKDRIRQQFAELTQQLKDDVTRAYMQGVEHVVKMLNERAAHRQDLESRRVGIHAMTRDRLPRLRELARRLDGEMDL